MTGRIPGDLEPAKSARGCNMSVEKPYPSIGQAVLLVVALLALQIAYGTAVAAALLIGGDKSPAASPAAIALGNVFCFGIVLLWGCKKAKEPLRTTIPLTPFPALILPAILFGAVGLNVLLSEFDNIVRHVAPVPEWIAHLMNDLSKGGAWSFVTLAVVAPITEEPLFRGLILGGFLRRYSVNKAVLISAVLFSLLHMNPYQLAPAFVLGVMMAWLLLTTRSLWPCILFHALYNSLGLILDLLGLSIPGYTDPLQPGTAVFQPWWLDVLGAVLLAVGILIFLRTPSPPARSRAMPDG